MLQRYSCQVVLPSVRCELGEGPAWSHGRLYWVDITGQTVHSFDPIANDHCSIPVPKTVGCVVPCASPAHLGLALEDEFALLDTRTHKLTTLCRTPMSQHDEQTTGGGKLTRFNDGKCDALGRFFAGTMGISKPRTLGAGRLWCLSRTSNPKALFQMREVVEVGRVTVSNGIGWTADSRRVMQFDYDLASSQLRNARVAVDMGPILEKGEMGLAGAPDGLAVDSEGMLWVAMFRGGQVTRWNPAKGTLIGVVDVPVPHVTSCCFGGPEGDTLFITTATGSTAEEQRLSTHPLAGCVFKAEVKVRGVVTHPFRIE